VNSPGEDAGTWGEERATTKTINNCESVSIIPKMCSTVYYTIAQGLVVRSIDSTIHQINPYPIDKIYTNSV